ncbi:MAG: UDP-N-acetylglucosamine 2-epimerase (non-hydrolyzing), partial [Firmicutes bacterium]|nr:UDP-N-acetylglucosamine 2-epimerase (non-hydrolyzing) [Bacillota bacterium]
MKKIMIIFGTRPEAIKMCPLIIELKACKKFQVIVCVTGQHREMLDQVLDCFGITTEYDFCVMKPFQNLFDITINIMSKVKDVMITEKPDIVLVHGDTTTTFISSLAAFYLGIKIGHIEAGLRTYDISSPFPEEFNRRATSLVASYHFAPTKTAKNNLIREGTNENLIYITGNTSIDALKTTVKSNYQHRLLDWAKNNRLIMVTAHRRENLGKPLQNMFLAIKKIVDKYHKIKVIYPVHLNPLIKNTAYKVFGDHERIKLIDPLDVLDFHNFLARSYLVLTDSGGIQEEATSLGKPVLV